MKQKALALLLFLAVSLIVPKAQLRVTPIDDLQGYVALGLALRHLSNTGIFMMTTAHPDDENNALLTMLNRGQGFRTALATATRGNGGQNEIGPELFEPLALLRTEELAAAHRFDGAEQYFTRAVDFGFSFSLDETLAKWGRDEIIGDFVRLIRTVRPDVMTGLTPSGAFGGQHHQASALLAREAFKAAGDPAQYPEQLKQGLRPWRPRKFYFTEIGPAEGGTTKSLSVNVGAYDRLIGRTYTEIGAEARSMHKCQGTGQVLPSTGPSFARYQLIESTLTGQLEREEKSLFDGVDTSLAGLAQFVNGRPPRELTDGLSAINTAVQNAAKRFEAEGSDAAVTPLLAGLRAVRVLRGRLRTLNLEDASRFEIEFRLRQKEREFQQALVLASGLRVQALADDGVVVPGQPLKVTMTIANRGAADIALKQIRFDGLEGDGICSLALVTNTGGFGLERAGGRGRGGASPAPPTTGAPISSLKKDQVARCDPMLRVPAGARITEPYWHREGAAGRYAFDDDAPFGQPFRPTSFYVQVTLGFAGGEEAFHGLPIEYRYGGSDPFSGEKRTELLVVPPVSVLMSPETTIAPVPVAPQSPPPPPPTTQKPPARTTQGTPATSAPGTSTTASQPGQAQGARRPVRPNTPTTAKPPEPVPPRPVFAERDVHVTVVNDTKGEFETAVTLRVPDGWTVTPAAQDIKFSREDEVRTLRFQVQPASTTTPGEYHVMAVAKAEGGDISRGYQVVEYPHIRRQHFYRAAVSTLKVIDVKAQTNLTVGYIMGVGDEVPSAIEQLGFRVTMIGPEELAWGDLSRFSTIVTGVRAYERRPDLRANNNRLIDYVRAGGTLIVQYNKFEFNASQYGPYPAKVSADRVTDENSAVRILEPADPIFSTPNRITEAVWKNWVQERGLYFLGERDSRYRDLVALEDPFPNNQGEKRGALVVAQYGKGRWVYVGLGLWRELPAGVDGAYQLLANLLSVGH
jgi:LmbE family N-acetylglucosaminyl deacetylase